MNATFQTLFRGAAKKCPRCGKGNLFASWGILVDRCAECGLNIRNREGNTWFLMYITTAGITGIFIIAMFLFAPKDALTGRIVLGVLAVAAFLGTHSGRKGFAIACEFLIENRMEHRPHEDQK